MTTHSPPTIDVLSALSATDADGVRRLFDDTLPLGLQDDRFDAWPSIHAAAPTPEAVAAIARADDQVIGYLGGPIAEGQAELDGLVHPSVADPAELVERMLSALEPTLHAKGANRAQLWAKPARPWLAEVAKKRGGAETRALHQMRCVLPVDIAPIESRDFDPERDLEALRTVNNRAFASHPDQGRQTKESLLASMSEPSFVPEGIRIHDRDGRMAGFCWTKIHLARTSFSRPGESGPRLGEIYVIGVDPDFHGRGMGAPMTAAGLHWMHLQGLEIGMLYVEADNLPAIKTYERLGFTILRTDQAWSVPLSES